MGTTYGFLPEIMEGYNYENLKYVKNIQNNYKLFKQKILHYLQLKNLLN